LSDRFDRLHQRASFRETMPVPQIMEAGAV